jgi:hypothetical protein
MGSGATSSSGPTRWRVILFRVIAGLLGIVQLTAVQLAISPWGPVALANPSLEHHPDLHRWANALAGGPDATTALVLLYLAWRPLGKPLIMQWLILAITVFFAANVFFLPGAAIFLTVLFIPVVIAYPEPRKLLTSPWGGTPSWALLVLALVITVLLVPDAWRALQAQLRGADELKNYDWPSNVEHLVNLCLIAFLAASRRPGWNVLAVKVTVDLLYLGIAAISVPNAPGSWGTIGGAIAIVGGLGFLSATVYEWRHGLPPADLRPALHRA